MDADCPSQPFGGSEEFAINPDGRTLVFAAKDVGREEAWSTNFDLFAVPLDGSSAPRRLTTNPATDTQPAFSPDGRTLAYLAMSRAGYEADRFRIVLRSWPDGPSARSTCAPTRRHRRSLSGGHRLVCRTVAGSLATADHLGQHSLFAVDATTGAARIVVERRNRGAPQSCAATGSSTPCTLFSPDRALHRRARRQRRRPSHARQRRAGRSRAHGRAGAVHVQGRERRHGPRLLVKPVDFDPAKKYPVAFLIHGGPQGSFGNDFHYRWNPQAYAGAGYAVVTDRLPRLDRLRPGLHRRHQRRLGRRAARGPDEGPRRRARALPLPRRHSASARSAPPTAAT